MSLMRIAFRALWITATVMMVFGILFAQAPSPDHTPDLIIWLIICTLLFAALCIGLAKRSLIGQVSLFLVGIQLILSIFAAASILPYLHSL